MAQTQLTWRSQMTRRNSIWRHSFPRILGAMIGLVLLLAACGGAAPSGGAATTGSTTAPAAAQPTAAPAAAQPTAAPAAAAEKTKIRFYGQIDEFASTPEMVAALKDHFKNKYDIEMIKVDFGNLDTIIKTGILSGDPADIYFYWPGALRSYIDADQVLDMTP